jgi:hypothetical protein
VSPLVRFDDASAYDQLVEPLDGRKISFVAVVKFEPFHHLPVVASRMATDVAPEEILRPEAAAEVPETDPAQLEPKVLPVSG